MSNKKLSERLNRELDAIGVPVLMTERVQICSKLFKIAPFKTEALLNGVVTIDSYAMQKIAEELEVSIDWLFGPTKEKTKH